MTETELVRRIALSSKLTRLKEAVASDIHFRSPGSFQFDPMLILMLISIAIQAIAYCRQKHTDEALVIDLRNARAIKPIRMRQFKRRLQRFCNDTIYPKYGMQFDKAIYDSAVDLIENAEDAEIKEILQIAREYSETTGAA
jgi:hypothetical protein